MPGKKCWKCTRNAADVPPVLCSRIRVLIGRVCPHALLVDDRIRERLRWEGTSGFIWSHWCSSRASLSRVPRTVSRDTEQFFSAAWTVPDPGSEDNGFRSKQSLKPQVHCFRIVRNCTPLLNFKGCYSGSFLIGCAFYVHPCAVGGWKQS